MRVQRIDLFGRELREEREVAVRRPQNAQKRIEFHVNEARLQHDWLHRRHRDEDLAFEAVRALVPIALVCRERELIRL
jgi:hypothetical protein